MSDSRSRRPAVAVGSMSGALLAALGYLLPWFPDAGWASGWAYLRDGGGPGWTVLPLLCLAAALLASVWAAGSPIAAGVVLVATATGLLLMAAVVAATAALLPEDALPEGVSSLSLGVGIPAMALGFGLMTASATWSMAAALLDEERRSQRRPATVQPGR